MSAVIESPWPELNAPPALRSDDVHVWHFPIGDRDCDPTDLSPAERERSNRFAFPHLRRRYIDAHAQMRRLLGGYLGRAPEKLTFEIADRGKPRLPGSPLHFNLSHTNDQALLAVTRLAEIGVDLECIDRRLDREGIAERFFSAAEAAELRSLPEDEQAEGFFNLWTRKEAWLKATGVGISEGLNGVEFNCRPGEAARLLRIEGSAGPARGWFVRTLRPLPDHVAAVALQTEGCEVRGFRLAALR